MLGSYVSAVERIDFGGRGGFFFDRFLILDFGFFYLEEARGGRFSSSEVSSKTLRTRTRTPVF